MGTGQGVKGRGNPDARTLMLGHVPGHEEIRLGKAMVGRTGVELDRIMWKVGIRPEGVWLDNLIEDAPTGEDWGLTGADIARNAARIDKLLYNGGAGWDNIVSMGAATTAYLLGDGVRADIGTVHAIPHQISLNNCPTTVFPTWHPAAGLHDGDAYPYIMSDFQLLAAYLNGNWVPMDRVDRHHGKERYTPLTDKDTSFIRNLFTTRNLDQNSWIYIDTEGSVAAPWCLTFSLKDGEGFMIQPKHRGALTVLMDEWRKWDMVTVMHYAVHDIPVLRAMGWDVVRGVGSCLDTMIAAYLLQIEPQGLKNLCYRHCGMEMKDYLDLVGPVSFDMRIAWLLNIQGEDWGKPEPILVEEKMGTKLVQPEGMNARVNKVIRKLEAGEEVDIYKWWKDTYPELQKPVIEKFGEIPTANLDHINFDEAMWYACRDADGTGRVMTRLADRLSMMELWDTFVMDCEVLPHIEEMQTTGFKTNPEHFTGLVKSWRAEQGKIRKQLFDMLGYWINPEAAPQVEKVIYDVWKMPVFKETKGGARSTADKAIDWLKPRHKGIELIGRSREYDKGCSSFAEPILEYAALDPEARLHGNFKYTRVVSGRFSMSEPNLLAMPVRSDLGKDVRNGFVARDGCLLGSWDLNQIEMRFMAHESGDADLIQTYWDGKDVHAETATRMFGHYNEEYRDAAKRVGFGVITGIQGAGLRDQFWLNGITKYDEQDCSKLIELWFEARPGVKAYLENCRAEARRYGWVRESIGGRIRYLQGIQSTNKKVAAEAERASHSHKISSGAQAIIKKGMAAAWPILEDLRTLDQVWIKWILQVHDELILEFEEGYEEVLDAIIQDALCNTVKLRVPIKAKGKWARTWGKLK